MSMRVDVYAFVKKYSLVEPERMHPIDDHILKAMHIESIYDMLSYVGSTDIDKLEKAGLTDLAEKLRRYGEIVVKEENIVNTVLTKVLGKNIEGHAVYLVLRASYP